MTRRIIFVGLAALFFSGCTGSVVYDVSNMEQPILLNRECITKGNSKLAAKPLCGYAGTISNAHSVASSPGTTYAGQSYTKQETRQMMQNNIQINAAKVLGGQDNRAITGLWFRVEDITINALVALGMKQSITASGTVVEISKSDISK
jgi:hypothetical protein